MGRFFSTLSIRWRLTATYVALVVAIVLLLGFALYRGLESFLLDDAAARTSADIQRVVVRELARDVRSGMDPNETPAPRPTRRPRPGQSVAPGGVGGVVTPTPVPTVAATAPPAPVIETPGRGAVGRLGRTLVAEVGGRDTSVVVLWPDQSTISASLPIPDVAPWPVPTTDEVAQAARGEPVRRIDGSRSPRAMLLVDAITADDGTLIAVTAVATSLETGDAALAQLRVALILGVLAAILLGVGLGLPITRIALRPLDRVVGAAERISAGDRGVRVGTADVPVEIGRLGEAFDTMVDRLEASAEVQRRFVADASHELRTPLAALGGMTEMLLLGIDQGDEAAVERVLTAMNREIGRLGRLASDLLLLSQLEDRAGRLPLIYVTVPVAEVAGEVVSELGSLLGERRVTVSVVPDGLVVAGDRDRLKQVLLNLVENAARHTEPNGTIVVAAGPTALGPPVAGGVSEYAVRISVTDDGVGLAEADVDRVFDRFYRADQARVRAGGAGLGLSIVRAIAESHGGWAEASSPGLGRGTTVGIVIPDRRSAVGGGAAVLVPTTSTIVPVAPVEAVDRA